MRGLLQARLGARGRGFFPGRAAVRVVGCVGDGPGEAAIALPEQSRPTRTRVDGVAYVTNHAPAETLNLFAGPPRERAPLLFLGGMAATPLPDGGSAWADLEGGRVVTFDRNGRVSGTLSGGPVGGEPLARPAFVVATDSLLLAVEIDGRSLAFREGKPVAWREAESPGAVVGGRGGLRAATRTVFDVTFSPLAEGDPLLWIGRDEGLRPVGRVEVPEQAMLAPLANAGWVALDGDEAVYFASALRPELRRYDADGTLEWIATWPREGVTEPRFGVSGSTLTPVFRLIQQAIAVGPDERVYVLATRGSDGPADRILVFDRDGTWVGDGAVEPGRGLYVGRRGHVYEADADAVLAEKPSREARTAFVSFELPALDGGPSLRLDDYRGRVVVVNFWASWCVPCRREMPLLSRFAAGLDTTEAAILGLNEDVDPDQGSAFVDELGGVAYPIAAGGGQLRDTYGYRGLPYTVVLDRLGRVAGTFYGFGDDIAPIEATVQRVLAEEGPTS